MLKGNNSFYMILMLVASIKCSRKGLKRLSCIYANTNLLIKCKELNLLPELRVQYAISSTAKSTIIWLHFIQRLCNSLSHRKNKNYSKYLCSIAKHTTTLHNKYYSSIVNRQNNNDSAV